jgi:fatty-acyl-CoA synthase
MDSRIASAFRESSNSMRPPKETSLCSTCRERLARSAIFHRTWRIDFRRPWCESMSRRFEGYTTRHDTEKKILRSVFKPGDEWVRSGDLMRKDEPGFFYFVDRIGDTFRRKGENVATSDVSVALSAYPGVEHANVYGVTVPGVEGRLGMAAVVAGGELDLVGLRKHLVGRLPPYARPVFLRIRNEVEVTGTFKYSKAELVRQGFDPAASADALYFDMLEWGAFVTLDRKLYDRIQTGHVRL